MTVLPSFCHFFVLLLHNFRYAPCILLRLYYLSALFFPCGGRRTRVPRPSHGLYDGRSTCVCRPWYGQGENAEDGRKWGKRSGAACKGLLCYFNFWSFTPHFYPFNLSVFPFSNFDFSFFLLDIYYFNLSVFPSFSFVFRLFNLRIYCFNPLIFCFLTSYLSPFTFLPFYSFTFKQFLYSFTFLIL